MNKTMRVVRHELMNNFRRPSYLIVAFGIPLLAVLIVGVITFIQSRSKDEGDGASAATPSQNLEVEGYVDPGGLVKVIPEDLPEGILLGYESESQAQEALAACEISAYYYIPADYVTSGEIFYVYPQSKSLLSDGQEGVMLGTLMLSLLDGDVETAGWIWNPVWQLEETQFNPMSAQQQPRQGEDCSRPGSDCESNELIRLIPSLMAAFLFISFMVSNNLLFQAIGIEKENRTLEVLLLSISPRQMLLGKSIAMGAAGLLHVVAWLAAVLVVFNLGGRSISLPENFVFPVTIFIWSLLYYLGGFAVYASLMAGVGAMVPRMKEAGAANFIVIIPLFIGYIIGIMAPLAEAVDDTLPLILSIFPLTSPLVMIVRLTNGPVPFWQLALSAVLLFVTAYFILQAVAAMFRAQILFTGRPFSIGRYFRVLFGGH